VIGCQSGFVASVQPDIVDVGWKVKFFALIGIAFDRLPAPPNLMANEMWRTLILLVLLLIVACQHKRPDFTSRIREDCAAGDQWACDLLDSLAQARTASDPISSDGTQKP
jgi:hypothetical protein